MTGRAPRFAALFAAGLGWSGLAPALALQQRPDPGAALEREALDPRVFSGELGPRDARLREPARTTDTPVAWRPPADPEEWEARAAELRRRVRVAAGVWPAAPPPGQPRFRGRVDRGDYSVEKVLFESQPGYFVTGSLYRPKAGPPRKPGVLCPHGHWVDGRLMERPDEEARALVEKGEERTLVAASYPLQARCAQLARMGCVVLHYDMIGYGDSRPFDHWSGFRGVEQALRLQSLFTFQTRNSIAALDVLCGLEDVDAERIGVTGASGGGTQTFVLTAVDPRVRVALPAVMVSTTFQGGCRCENGSHLRLGTSNVEITALAAPRPLALTGANDWTVRLEEEVLPPLEELYRSLGAPGNVTARCWPEFEHNYNVHARELMYAWFDRHLGLGLGAPIREREFEPIAPAELSVFDAAHPDPPPGARSEREILAAEARARDLELAELLAAEDPDAHGRMRAVVEPALRVLLATGLPEGADVERRVLRYRREPGRDVLHLALGREGAGEALPAVLVRPAEWNGTVVVAVAGGGKRELLVGEGGAAARGAPIVASGAALLAVDVLLTGEHLAVSGGGSGEVPRLPVDPVRHGDDLGYTYAYRRTLLAERVHDVLTALAFARSLEGTRRVGLWGSGRAGPWVLLARALAGDAVDRTLAPWSWDFDRVRSFADEDLLPGALRYGGMKAFSALIAPGPLWLIAADGEPEPPAPVARAYRALGAGERLRTTGPEACGRALAWLAEEAGQ